jgi:hypothetical protein
VKWELLPLIDRPQAADPQAAKPHKLPKSWFILCYRPCDAVLQTCVFWALLGYHLSPASPAAARAPRAAKEAKAPPLRR